MRVEVIYCEPDREVVEHIELDNGATVADLLALMGGSEKFSGVEIVASRVGVWGRLAGPDTLLSADDRVEIYRELLADPKSARRRRARQQAAQESKPGA